MRRVRDLAVLVGATAVSLLGLCDVAAAETYEVTRTDDPGIGPCLPGDCSLREAARAADFSVGVPDVIVVPASAEHYAIEQGAIEIGDTTEVRAAGADKVVLDSNGKSFAVETEGLSVVLSGLTITGGHGGIQDNSAELTLRGVSIEHNDRIDGGGGGIQANGKLKVDSSFIGFNSTNGTAGGAIQSNEPLTIVNSTLASNRSLGPAIHANSETKISSSAVVSNTRVESDGSAGIGGPGPVTISDDIIAGNRDPGGTENCGGSGPSLISTGGNVVDDATCAAGGRDRANTAPGLGTLELHGGTTPVFSLLPGSSAVDFGLNCPPTDQRGAPRPQGAACDSGPFELEQAAPAPLDRSVSILIGGGRVHINRKGFGRIRLTCPAGEQSPPCSGVLKLFPRSRVLGASKVAALASAKFTIGAGKTKRVKVRLSSVSVDHLREDPASRRVRASARVSDAAGNVGTAQRVIRLVPSKRR